jgi:hypothetical protein
VRELSLGLRSRHYFDVDHQGQRSHREHASRALTSTCPFDEGFQRQDNAEKPLLRNTQGLTQGSVNKFIASLELSRIESGLRTLKALFDE